MFSSITNKFKFNYVLRLNIIMISYLYTYVNIYASLNSPKIVFCDLNLPCVMARAVEYNRRVEPTRQFKHQTVPTPTAFTKNNSAQACMPYQCAYFCEINPHHFAISHDAFQKCSKPVGSGLVGDTCDCIAAAAKT